MRRGEERAGAQQLRIGHGRHHDDRQVEHALDAEAIVPMLAREPVRKPEQLSGEPTDSVRPVLLEQRR